VRRVSGQYRGKHIHPPKIFRARPTTDFAKEALFNILMNEYDLESVEVLDLFSGTGSISYEFASRGARGVVSVESDVRHHSFIQRTCREMNMDRVVPLRADAFKYLKNPSQAFDIVFADPPFDHPELDRLPDLVTNGPLLAAEGRFILEHPSGHSFTDHPAFREERRYGGVHFSFFSSL